MPRGSSDIPELKLGVLQKFVTTFMNAPDLLLTNIFSSSPSPSSLIPWESKRGGRGMTPFVPPGAPAPVTSPYGVAQHQAEAAYWKEKMPFDEEFLNNLRKEGTEVQYLDAKTRLARELASLVNRSNRRKEWMFAKMFFEGSFSYKVKRGFQAEVDYQIPSDHLVTLGSAYNWYDGASKNILGDIRAGKRIIKEDCGGTVNLAICNSKVLEYLANDSTLQGLLRRDAFMSKNLFEGKLDKIVGVNPKVLGTLLDIDKLVIYDEMYEVRAWLTAAVSANSSTWISVDDVSDLETGQKARFVDSSASTYEDRYIVAINTTTNVIQLDQAPAASYKASEDYILMRKYFVPDDKFVMMSTTVDGDKIAEYKEAPFGLGRHYGNYTDKRDEWDPEVTWIRVQDKGLPILYQRDAIYVIDVKETAGQSAVSSTTTTSTTTTTTTSSSSTTTTGGG